MIILFSNRKHGIFHHRILKLIKNNHIHMSEQNNQNQINIELSEDVSEGVYSNLAIISHFPFRVYC